MCVRNDHNVPTGVGIGVEDDEAMFATVNDVILAIVVLRDLVAENAAGCAIGRGDVGIAPRRPEIVHGASL